MSSKTVPNRVPFSRISKKEEIIHTQVIFRQHLDIITNNIVNRDRVLCYKLEFVIEEV